MHERFEVVCIPCKALYKCSALPFFLPFHKLVSVRPTMSQVTLKSIKYGKNMWFSYSFSAHNAMVLAMNNNNNGTDIHFSSNLSIPDDRPTA